MSDGFQPGFQLIHGNRVEDLGDLLVALLKRHPLKPLEPAAFLVQSNGMAQWLKLRLARPDAWGISAAVDMQMPARFIWNAWRAVLGGNAVPEQSPFDKDRLTWRLMRLLPSCLAATEPSAEFDQLARYLRDDRDLRKRYQLAARLADLFDQYQVYRGDWLAAWAAGRDELLDAMGQSQPLADDQRWQAALWRRMLADVPAAQAHTSRAQLQERFLGTLAEGSGAIPGLPRRLVVFGISSLPQQQLDTLAGLARRLQVQVFVHNPCRYYWADIIEARDLLRSQRRQPRKNALLNLDSAELHLQVNPLLAAWGRQGRDYIGLLDRYDQASADAGRVDLFRDWLSGAGEDDATPPLLTQIQQGILDLEPAPSPRRAVAVTDDSLTFQIAHSRQREVEILHDRLLDLFERSETAAPRSDTSAAHGASSVARGTFRGTSIGARDVIVMVPDIDAYAPHIEAVFGNVDQSDTRYIPYTIADRPARGASPLLTALERLLRLPDARFGASEVLSLLEVPAFRRRFGIGEDELSLVRQWVRQSGIRWGLDAEQRAALQLPTGLHQNSWRFGLDRMLLGYAVGEAGGWHGIEPFAEPSGQGAALVGQLARLLDQLEGHWRQMAQSRAPAAWGRLLRELLEACFVPEDAREQLLLERFDDTLEQWLAACEAAALTEPLPLAVVRETLLGAFDEQSLSQRFLAGCVNFCTLMPMRAIPFPVVCLLGMNDGDYPRQRPPNDFDLMAAHYRPGDRSRREDDRYLFLEALLSARHQLYISYVGRDERDNSERTPSVLVGQLRDHIAAGWCPAGDETTGTAASGKALLVQLTVHHPLQPFSARYFQPDPAGQLFTYVSEWQAGREGQLGSKGQGGPHTPAVMPRIEWIDEPVTLGELAGFLRRPADYFFSRRLGVDLERSIESIEDDEPFTLDGLPKHQLKTALVDAGRMALEPGGLNVDIRDGCVEQDSEGTAQATIEAMTDASITAEAARLIGQGVLPPGAGGTLLAEALTAQSRATIGQWQTAVARWRHPADPVEIDLSLIDGALNVEDWLAGLRADDDGRLALVDYRASQAYTGKRYKYHYFTGLWVRYLAARACGHDVAALLVATDGIHRFPALDDAEARRHLNAVAAACLAGLNQPLPTELATAMRWLEMDCPGMEEPAMDGAGLEAILARKALAAIYEGDYNHTGAVADSAVLARCWPDLGALLAAGFTDWAPPLYQPLATALENMEHTP